MSRNTFSIVPILIKNVHDAYSFIRPINEYIMSVFKNCF
jgi:hypothetical protein